MQLLASDLTAALLLIKIVLFYFKKALLLIRLIWSWQQLFNHHKYWLSLLFRSDKCLLSDRKNISIALGLHELSINLIITVLRAWKFFDFWFFNARVFIIDIFFKSSFRAARRTELRARYKIIVALEKCREFLYCLTLPALMIGL